MRMEPSSKPPAPAAGTGDREPPWLHPDTESYPDLNYLLSEGARARYVLAAHYLRECDHVVEIGGFKTPVTAYLTVVPRSVLVLDPKMPEFETDTLQGLPCRVRHLALRYQDWDFQLEAGSYGLVILGLSMKYFSKEEEQREAEWAQLTGLVERSRIAVLESPVEWELGAGHLERLCSTTRTRTRLRIDLDLGESPGMDTPYHRRRFVVLEPLGTSGDAAAAV